LSNSTLFADRLDDFTSCLLNVPYLVKLGINTILVSGFRVGANHNQCMELLKNAGIYVIVILNGVNQGTNYSLDGLQTSWGYTSYDAFETLIDTFQGHSNTLGFAFLLADWSEIMMGFVPLIKAAIRDAREYVKAKRYRNIPIGVVAQNHANPSIAQFMNCAEESSSSDFLALRLSDLSTKSRSGPNPESQAACFNLSMIQEQIIDIYQGYGAPIIPTYGCTANGNHTFEEIQLISNRSDLFSGQIIETWFDGKTSGKLDQGIPPVIGNL
jgi:Glucanosyltransferase